MAELTDKLITFAYMRGEVDLPQNLPQEEFDGKITRAQERLRMLMGDGFYQDFLTTYKASNKNNPLTGAYASLYDPYIKQFIAHQAYVFWTLEANFKPTRSGIRVHTEDNSEAASDVQMSMLLKDRKQSAEYYAKLLTDFMDFHHTDYPLYRVNCIRSTGNAFHISAVRRQHGHDCKCRSCRH